MEVPPARRNLATAGTQRLGTCPAVPSPIQSRAGTLWAHSASGRSVSLAKIEAAGDDDEIEGADRVIRRRGGLRRTRDDSGLAGRPLISQGGGMYKGVNRVA